MRIAVLGWSSLVTTPGQLRMIGEWAEGGPVLPLEFSRQNGLNRPPRTLAPVIDPTNGVGNAVLHVTSGCSALNEARANLGDREGNHKRIGHATRDGQVFSQFPTQAAAIARWLETTRYDAVVWNDLGTNFPGFTPEAALAWINALPEDERAAAEEAVRTIPAQIRTPFRTLFNGR